MLESSVRSIFSATSLGSTTPAWYSLHRRWVSSWSMRSSFAWPWGLNDCFIIAIAWAGRSGSAIIEAQPATVAATAAATMKVIFVIRMARSSALDGRGVEDASVGVARQVHGERDGSGRDELQLRHALLAEAVVQAPLERAHLALRDAVGGPRGVGALRIGGLGEVGQVLQPDALVVRAMARGAAEIVRAGAMEEDRPADLVGFLLLRII